MSVSLAHALAASLATLTLSYSKKEEKRVYDMFFKSIAEEAHKFKEEIGEPEDLFEDLMDNKKPS